MCDSWSPLVDVLCRSSVLGFVTADVWGECPTTAVIFHVILFHYHLHSGCQLSGRQTSEPMRSSTWLGEELTGKYYARLPEISLVEFSGGIYW